MSKQQVAATGEDLEVVGVAEIAAGSEEMGMGEATSAMGETLEARASH